MAFLWLLIGIVCVGVTGFDVFQTVIVPRPTGRSFRPSAYLNRWFWFAWRWRALSITQSEKRESFLGAFAPLVLVTLLVFWIFSLVVGYGFVFFALRQQIKPVPGLADSLYFAGTSLLTIGYGDLAPSGAGARFVSLCAGASGLGAFAIITAFLFAIFGSYQQREAFVVSFTNRAGAPPSGVDMIETHAQLGIVDSLLATLRDSETWLAQVLETHLAYPILPYFRSTHDEISWVAVVGTILDASTLAITTLDLPSHGEAKIVNRLGRHLVRDFSHYFGLSEGDNVGIERHEFDLAYERLRAAGIKLREREGAWTDFAAIRSTYASQLNTMAQFWRIPPAQWVGDRSLILHQPPLRFGGTTLQDAVTTIDA
jgi:hypothetical protein